MFILTKIMVTEDARVSARCVLVKYKKKIMYKCEFNLISNKWKFIGQTIFYLILYYCCSLNLSLFKLDNHYTSIITSFIDCQS